MRRITLVSLVATLCGCPDAGTPDGGTALVVEFTAEEARRIEVRTPLLPAALDETNAYDGNPDAIALGRRLFFDTRLSANNDIACADCHQTTHGFSDDVALSEGVGTTLRHSPHVYNLGHSRWFFWDGRADSLWSQALFPIEDGAEMANDRTHLVRTLAADSDMRADLEALFGMWPDLSDSARFPEHARYVAGDEQHPHHIAWLAMDEADRLLVDGAFAQIGKALAAYEARLVSGESPFDRFAQGLAENDEAKLASLSPSEQRGLKLFVGDANCWFCHTGALFSDREFHNIGLDNDSDLGRFIGTDRLLSNPFNATGIHSDDPGGVRADRLEHLLISNELMGQFKTSSLRNVALHPPYMHDGRFASLADVVRHYSELESFPEVGHREDSLIPLDLDDAAVEDLVAFLHSLTGDEVPSGLGAP